LTSSEGFFISIKVAMMGDYFEVLLELRLLLLVVVVVVVVVASFVAAVDDGN
jgi:uncharacterized protein (UPF0333 family)